MTQQRHVIDRVRAGDHARDQRGHLQSRVRALVARHAEVLISQVAQPGPVGKGEDRDQAAGRHEIRIVERHRGSTKGYESRILKMPS